MSQEKDSETRNIRRITVQFPEPLFLELKESLDEKEMTVSQFFRKAAKEYLAKRKKR